MILLLMSVIFTICFLLVIYTLGFRLDRSIFIKALLGMGGFVTSVVLGIQAFLNIVSLGLNESQSMAKGTVALEKLVHESIEHMPSLLNDAFVLAKNNCPDGFHIYLLIGSIIVSIQGFNEIKGCITTKRNAQNIP